MPFKEKNKRNKVGAKIPADAVEGAPPPIEAKVKVASVDDTPPEAYERLLAEIAGLKAQLVEANAGRSKAEQDLLDAAQAQGALLQTEIQEVPTGKTITVKRVDYYKVVGHKDDGRDILRPVWKDVKLPTYFYKIDLPPIGGFALMINEVGFYHGTVYELDIDSLRSVKDQVHKLWKHDSNVHGSNENAYRPKQQRHISMRQA